MVNSLVDEKLTSSSYDEYIDKVINIFRLSSDQSSILFDIKIKDYQATIVLSIINQEGEKQEFNDVVLKCDDAFYHSFLLVLVDKLQDLCHIETKDIVQLSDDSLVTFRMITVHNDLFTIDGLSLDDANNLMKLADQEKNINVLPEVNNEGTGSPQFLLFMVGTLIVFLIIIVLLVD